MATQTQIETIRNMEKWTGKPSDLSDEDINKLDPENLDNLFANYKKLLADKKAKNGKKLTKSEQRGDLPSNGINDRINLGMAKKLVHTHMSRWSDSRPESMEMFKERVKHLFETFDELDKEVLGVCK